MSKSHTQELDIEIQLSLVTRIRQAAHTYRNTPTESAALTSYVSALECLAEYVAARCRETREPREIPFPAQRTCHAVSVIAKTHTENRVIPFPSQSGAPLPAA